MAKYVDIDAVKEAVRGAECDANWDGRRFDAEFIENALDFIPAADVAPVVYGRWELLRKGDWNSVFVCSVCGRRETIAESESYNSQLKMPRKYPYCHCGARMDGDADDETG